jgi:hypothetical protein
MVRAPGLDEGMERWIYKTAHKEHWRCRAWYDLDDLIQDGFLCYCKCYARYWELIQASDDRTEDEKRRWFMALVQSSFYHKIMTLSSKAVQCTENTLAELSVSDQEVSMEAVAGGEAEITTLVVALANAPAELAGVVKRLVEDGLDGGAYLRNKIRWEGTRRTRRARAVRETRREYYERLTGIADLPQKLAHYLGE